LRKRHDTLLGVRRKMDAFSEVLSGVRLKDAMFFSAEFSAPERLQQAAEKASSRKSEAETVEVKLKNMAAKICGPLTSQFSLQVAFFSRMLAGPHSRTLASTLAPGAPHLVIYHFVVDGSARAPLEGGPDVELSPGNMRVLQSS
jgi:hypothetical protein